MPSVSLRSVALTAVAGGIAWLVFAVQALVTPEVGEPARIVLTGLADRVSWILFALCLALTVSALLALHLHHRGADGRLGQAGAFLAMAGVTGQCVVISTIAISGEEPVWFNTVAPVAILTWVVGSVVLAVAMGRARLLPRWVVVLLPIATAFAIVGADYGTSVLIGAFQVVVGLRIARAAAAGVAHRGAMPAAARV